MAGLNPHRLWGVVRIVLMNPFSWQSHFWGWQEFFISKNFTHCETITWKNFKPICWFDEEIVLVRHNLYQAVFGCVIREQVLSTARLATYWERMLCEEKRKWRHRRWNALELYITHLFNFIFSAHCTLSVPPRSFFPLHQTQQHIIRRFVCVFYYYVRRGGEKRQQQRGAAAGSAL